MSGRPLAQQPGPAPSPPGWQPASELLRMWHAGQIGRRPCHLCHSSRQCRAIPCRHRRPCLRCRHRVARRSRPARRLTRCLPVAAQPPRLSRERRRAVRVPAGQPRHPSAVALGCPDRRWWPRLTGGVAQMRLGAAHCTFAAPCAHFGPCVVLRAPGLVASSQRFAQRFEPARGCNHPNRGGFSCPLQLISRTPSRRFR